jgi:hypothetical protein
VDERYSPDIGIWQTELWQNCLTSASSWLEAKIDVGDFNDNSITDVLEPVAREAGLEGALLLAKMFEIELPDDFAEKTLSLPRPNRSNAGSA